MNVTVLVNATFPSNTTDAPAAVVEAKWALWVNILFPVLSFALFVVVQTVLWHIPDTKYTGKFVKAPINEEKELNFSNELGKEPDSFLMKHDDMKTSSAIVEPAAEEVSKPASMQSLNDMELASYISNRQRTLSDASASAVLSNNRRRRTISGQQSETQQYLQGFLRRKTSDSRLFSDDEEQLALADASANPALMNRHTHTHGQRRDHLRHYAAAVARRLRSKSTSEMSAPVAKEPTAVVVVPADSADIGSISEEAGGPR